MPSIVLATHQALNCFNLLHNNLKQKGEGKTHGVNRYLHFTNWAFLGDLIIPGLKLCILLLLLLLELLQLVVGQVRVRIMNSTRVHERTRFITIGIIIRAVFGVSIMDRREIGLWRRSRWSSSDDGTKTTVVGRYVDGAVRRRRRPVLHRDWS